jgi:hypothetical protein
MLCKRYYFSPCRNAVLQGTYELLVGHGKDLNPNSWSLGVEISGYSSYHGVVDTEGEEDSKMVWAIPNSI